MHARDGSLVKDHRANEIRHVLLPNLELACVDERKIHDYLLSSEHPIGRFKAAFFRSLGYTRECPSGRAHPQPNARAGAR